MKTEIYRILLAVGLILFTQCNTCQQSKYQPVGQNLVVMESDSVKNRPPAVAGTFYPATQRELLQNLEKLFATGVTGKNLGHVAAVISPHAGYVYSGTVAASAFNQLSPEYIYDNVFLIGSSHHVSFDGAAVYTLGDFITPMGRAAVNTGLSQKLVDSNPELFIADPDVHSGEHSLEVQVPFLQYIYRERLQIVPIIIATNKSATVKKIADALEPYFGGNNLFVISTDFSHYPDYESAISVDKGTAEAIIKNSAEDFLKVIKNNQAKGISNLATSICGWTSVLALLDITEVKDGIKYYDIQYLNSGDAAYGDKRRVVGYHAIAVVNNLTSTIHKDVEKYLSKEEEYKLLNIARKTIEEYLEKGKVPEITFDVPVKLRNPGGAFVTLTKEGKLRGCIGQFNADKPLYQVVQDMAVSAATRDSRFNMVTRAELDKLEIEISVLTPMHKIDSIQEIILGKHGIYIIKGNNSGTFLPQVADQTGWTLEEFLGHCSRDKAGLGWDGWKNADIYIYEAYVFGEQ